DQTGGCRAAGIGTVSRTYGANARLGFLQHAGSINRAPTQGCDECQIEFPLPLGEGEGEGNARAMNAPKPNSHGPHVRPSDASSETQVGRRTLDSRESTDP